MDKFEESPFVDPAELKQCTFCVPIAEALGLAEAIVYAYLCEITEQDKRDFESKEAIRRKAAEEEGRRCNKRTWKGYNIQLLPGLLAGLLPYLSSVAIDRALVQLEANGLIYALEGKGRVQGACEISVEPLTIELLGTILTRIRELRIVRKYVEKYAIPVNN